MRTEGDRRYVFHNSRQRAVTLFIEPWAWEYFMAPGARYELVIRGAGADFYLQIDMTEPLLIVWLEGTLESFDVFDGRTLLEGGYNPESDDRTG